MSVQMSQCDRNELKGKCGGKSSKQMDLSRRFKEIETETADISSNKILDSSIGYREKHDSDCERDVTKLTMTIVNQMSHQFKDALDLKSESSVNGIVNGFGVLHCETDSSHMSSLLCDEEPHCQEVALNGCEDEEDQEQHRMKQKVDSKVDLVSDIKVDDSVLYVSYESELQMPSIVELIQKDLSEPYSIYTYRYFIHNWPKLCFLAMCDDKCVGAIVCKLDMHKKIIKRGYIAMLAVDEQYRKRKIGSNLVLKAIRAMATDDADEVVLETEITNEPALKLYENLGFVRDKRLFRYYLNGVDALRLKLWLR